MYTFYLLHCTTVINLLLTTLAWMTYMLFAGIGLVCIVKNCDQGLENGSPRSQFLTIQTDTKLPNTMFIFFFCSKFVLQITNGFVYATLFIESDSVLSTNDLWKNLCNEWVTQILDKERCSREQIFFELLYVSCIYFTS